MRSAGLGVLLAVALVVAGCGGGSKESQPEPSSQATPQPPPRHVEPPARPRTCKPGERGLGSSQVSYFALVHSDARAYRAPGRSAFASFGPKNANGFPTLFGVLRSVVGRDCRTRWYRVQLPLRPNGSTGYVRASDVELGTVRTRVLVDLSVRRVTLFRDGQRVLHAVAAVGARETPTPTGRFYVNQLLTTDQKSGPWGPAAIGISAFSPVLQNWAQGGPIAIHGTNEPSSIGRAASHGCIRLDNAVLERLFEQTPAGTPVVIRA